MAEYINYNETSIANLPVAEDINLNDYIIVQPQDFNNKTCILQFKNLVFGMENVSFANTITQNSTNIVQLSSDIKNCNDLVAGVDERINEVEESLKNDITAVENIVNEVNSKITDINTSTTTGAISGSRIIDGTITYSKLASGVIPSYTPFTPNLDNIPPCCFPDFSDVTTVTLESTNSYQPDNNVWIHFYHTTAYKIYCNSIKVIDNDEKTSAFIPVKKKTVITGTAGVSCTIFNIKDGETNIS